MKINWKVKALALCIVLAGGAYAGFNYYQAKQVEKEAASVETVSVARMDLSSTVSATGTISPVDSVEVSPKITARITSVLVKENDTVEAGQIVATLDGTDYEAKRDQAQYNVTYKKSRYERAKYLNSIGAKSDADLESALYEYQTAESNLISAQSDVSNTIITAPMNGIVVGAPKTVGTMAVQGNSNPTVIMIIADLSKKQILAQVDETDIGSIKVGQRAKFTVDAYTDKTFRARVAKISQTDTSNTWEINGSSKSTSSSSSASVIYYYVTLDVDDPEGILLPAMTARLDILTAHRKNVLAIPISAMKTDSKGSYVVLAKEKGSTENRYIKTGLYSDEYVEVVEGLSEGDELVTTYTAKSVSGSNSQGKNESANRQTSRVMRRM